MGNGFRPAPTLSVEQRRNFIAIPWLESLQINDELNVYTSNNQVWRIGQIDQVNTYSICVSYNVRRTNNLVTRERNWFHKNDVTFLALLNSYTLKHTHCITTPWPSLHHSPQFNTQPLYYYSKNENKGYLIFISCTDGKILKYDINNDDYITISRFPYNFNVETIALNNDCDELVMICDGYSKIVTLNFAQNARWTIRKNSSPRMYYNSLIDKSYDSYLTSSVVINNILYIFNKYNITKYDRNTNQAVKLYKLATEEKKHVSSNEFAATEYIVSVMMDTSHSLRNVNFDPALTELVSSGVNVNDAINALLLSASSCSNNTECIRTDCEEISIPTCTYTNNVIYLPFKNKLMMFYDAGDGCGTVYYCYLDGDNDTEWKNASLSFKKINNFDVDDTVRNRKFIINGNRRHDLRQRVVAMEFITTKYLLRKVILAFDFIIFFFFKHKVCCFDLINEDWYECENQIKTTYLKDDSFIINTRDNYIHFIKYLQYDVKICLLDLIPSELTIKFKNDWWHKLVYGFIRELTHNNQKYQIDDNVTQLILSFFPTFLY